MHPPCPGRRTPQRRSAGLVLLASLLSLSACAGPAAPSSSPSASSAASSSTPAMDSGTQADDLLIVDCLMPAQVRRLGSFATGVSPRRPEKLPAGECRQAGGEYAIASRDPAAALRLWLPFAEQGDAQAQNQVGELYERGLGTLADPGAAARWYQKAADQGDSRALINLASLYERGLGVTRDPQQAAQLFRRASGLAPAPAALSIHLLEPLVMLPAGETDVQVPVVRLPGSGATSEQGLRGRVNAEAGLRSLQLNGQTLPVDAQGIFRVVPDLSQGPAPLHLVATDRQGRQVQAHLTAVADRAAAPPPAKASGWPQGTAYALVIANQHYQRWTPLDTPLRDAHDLAAVLTRRFGFHTTMVLNATRRDILNAFVDLRRKLGPQDSLLVFYAGHGDIDPATQRGYWIPVDGERRHGSNWISVLDVTDQLSALPARQVLVVADSCYSGTMGRSALPAVDAELAAEKRPDTLRALARLRARVALTSGGMEPVADGGGGRNSLFARQLLDVLQALNEPTEAQRVHAELAARFSLRAQALHLRQRPSYAPIRYAGHEAGDFVFVPRR